MRLEIEDRALKRRPGYRSRFIRIVSSKRRAGRPNPSRVIVAHLGSVRVDPDGEVGIPWRRSFWSKAVEKLAEAPIDERTRARFIGELRSRIPPVSEEELRAFMRMHSSAEAKLSTRGRPGRARHRIRPSPAR